MQEEIFLPSPTKDSISIRQKAIGDKISQLKAEAIKLHYALIIQENSRISIRYRFNAYKIDDLYIYIYINYKIDNS